MPGLFKCGNCHKTYSNPVSHVCRIGWSKSKGQTTVRKPKPKRKRKK
jgi:hypothetical protein